nr:MAG TPA: hypothetical protein [Caudoviricetes sp.]
MTHFPLVLRRPRPFLDGAVFVHTAYAPNRYCPSSRRAHVERIGWRGNAFPPSGVPGPHRRGTNLQAEISERRRDIGFHKQEMGQNRSGDHGRRSDPVHSGGRSVRG